MASAFLPSNSAPIMRSAIGVAVTATFEITFKGISGIVILKNENGIPAKIPNIIGLVITFLIVVFTKFPSFFLFLDPNVNIITEYMLYSGIADTIISGAIPELPYIFSTNAIPRIAPLPRTDACENAPTIDLSFINIDVNAHTPINMTVVTAAQNITNFQSKDCLISAVAISLNKSNGSATLNTYLSAIAAKSLVKSSFFIKIHPNTITKNIGTVAFKLNIKFPIIPPIITSLNHCI